MCGLCGVLGGGPHWTESSGAEGEPPSAQRRRQRQQQTRLANAVLRCYRLRLDDWQGRSYMLSSATGKTELVDDLMSVWAAAERLAGRVVDPLDPTLLAELGDELSGQT